MSLQFTDTIRFRRYAYELLELTTEEGRLVRWRDVSTDPVVRASVW